MYPHHRHTESRAPPAQRSLHHHHDHFEIGRVITIVEVKQSDGNVGLRVRAGQYPWVALGMLEFAKKVVESQGASPQE